VESTENFVVADIVGKKIRFHAFRPDGSTIDTAELGQ
jgi:hypothetical protein